MRVMYEIADGYAGKSRPQYVEVDNEEIELCESENEFNELISAAIQDHFEHHIYPIYDLPEWPENYKKIELSEDIATAAREIKNIKGALFAMKYLRESGREESLQCLKKIVESL